MVMTKGNNIVGRGNSMFNAALMRQSTACKRDEQEAKVARSERMRRAPCEMRL